MPHACKSVGWVVLGVGILLMVIWIVSDSNFDFTINDIRRLLGLAAIATPADVPGLTNFTADSGLLNTTVSVLIIVGGYLVGFSLCKEEDEFTEHIRYRALTVTMFILLGVGLITEIFCWGWRSLIVRNMLHMFFPVFYVLYLQITLYVERRRNEE